MKKDEIKKLTNFCETLDIPNKGMLEKMNLFKLNSLANEIMELIEDEMGFLSCDEVDELKSIKSLHNLFKIRGSRLYKAAIDPKFLKKTSKIQKKNFEAYSRDYSSVDKNSDFGGEVFINAPIELYEKVVKKLIGTYKDSVAGVFILSLSKNGNPKELSLFDTMDRETFIQFFRDAVNKNRKGSSPNASATIFKVGTIVSDSTGNSYQVKLVNKTKRWVVKR